MLLNKIFIDYSFSTGQLASFYGYYLEVTSQSFALITTQLNVFIQEKPVSLRLD